VVAQKSLIVNNNTFTEEQAIKFLEDRGFTIIKEGINELSTLTSIVDLFYINLNRLYKDLKYEAVVTGSNKADINAVSKYVKKCNKLGITKKKALDVLSSTLDLYFKYYNEIGLTEPAGNLRFLLCEGSWIFNKIGSIHKHKMEEYKDSMEMEQWRDGLYNQDDDIMLKLREQRHQELLNLNTGEFVDGQKEE
jgi:hypothetical protein